MSALRALRTQPDLMAALAAAATCALLVVLLPWGGPRMVAAVPLALILPGYAITAACFAGRSLEGATQLLLSIALSLSALTIASLLLHFPDGLRRVPWAALLSLIVLAGCLVAAPRRPAAARVALPRFRPRLRRLDAALLAATLLAVATTVSISATALPADDAVGYTRLWMLPNGDSENPLMRIGIRSQEQERTRYTLEVRIGDHRTFQTFSLSPDHARVIHRDIALPPPGGSTPVVALLYKGDRLGSPYRRVTGWIPAS
jgi:uncharacterized membrane protein